MFRISYSSTAIQLNAIKTLFEKKCVQKKRLTKIGSDIRGNDFEVVATFSIYSSEWPKFLAHLANSYENVYSQNITLS